MLENPGRNLSFSGAYDLYDLYDLRLSHLQRLTFSGQVLPLAPSLSSASKRSAITPWLDIRHSSHSSSFIAIRRHSIIRSTYPMLSSLIIIYHHLSLFIPIYPYLFWKASTSWWILRSNEPQVWGSPQGKWDILELMEAKLRQWWHCPTIGPKIDQDDPRRSKGSIWILSNLSQVPVFARQESGVTEGISSW